MKMLFRLLRSPVTDRMAYASAVVCAVCWLVHIGYPAVMPGHLKAAAHIYATVAASLAGGMMIAKYVFTEGYSRSIQEANTEKEAFAAAAQRLESKLQEARQEKDRILEREAALAGKLKKLENHDTEGQLSVLRKKIRKDAEDRKAALAFLVRELGNHMQELDLISDPEIAHAAAVLKKETQLLDDEIRRGEKSLYELVLSISEIQKHAYDLMSIRIQSAGGPGEGVRDPQQPGDFAWFSAETDPSHIDRIYKFLKVAFHPDRFTSETLKEQAKVHFQQAGKAYTTFKERLRATH
jgi:hypothetical protein